jgi:hypothetical protein
MSYANIAAMVEDWDLRMRLIACAAQEQADGPVLFVEDNIWRICAQPGWDAAWASALVTHADDEDYRPGADEGVIPDAKILSGVQKVIKDQRTTVVASARSVEDANAARLQAEDDREFARHVRMREWELAHQPTEE